MARAKCRWCKAEVDTKVAFKIIVGKINHYYCDGEHYHCAEKARLEQEKITKEYNEIFDTTKEIFGYEFTGYSLLKREITTWERLATRQKIIAFLRENKDWLSRTMSRSFDSEYGRIRYYSVVVSGKLHDFKPKVVEEPIILPHEEHYETKYKMKTRQSLEDLEDDYDE